MRVDACRTTWRDFAACYCIKLMCRDCSRPRVDQPNSPASRCGATSLTLMPQIRVESLRDDDNNQGHRARYEPMASNRPNPFYFADEGSSVRKASRDASCGNHCAGCDGRRRGDFCMFQAERWITMRGHWPQRSTSVYQTHSVSATASQSDVTCR